MGLGAILSAMPLRSAAAQQQPDMHVVFLGDSTLDNASYVAAGEDVHAHLTSLLPNRARATLLAIDGSTISGVERQLRDLPSDATHLVVSVGGNDALAHARILGEPAESMATALTRLASIREEFSQAYATMLGLVLGYGRPTAISTIYEAAFPDAELRRLGRTALSVLNDCITREASIRGLPVLDLRVIFDEDADYANAIEPSGRGGRKLARAIAEVVSTHDFANGRAEMFGTRS